MGPLSKIFSNTRKPEGFWGKMMVAGMNGGSHAEIAQLPFADNTFTMATAFETIYFWPDIERSFAEVRRVLVLGGKFLIVNEDDGLSGNNGKWEKLIDGMHTYTPDEVKTHLTAAGFKNITIHRNEPKHWLAVTAVK